MVHRGKPPVLGLYTCEELGLVKRLQTMERQKENTEPVMRVLKALNKTYSQAIGASRNIQDLVKKRRRTCSTGYEGLRRRLKKSRKT